MFKPCYLCGKFHFDGMKVACSERKFPSLSIFNIHPHLLIRQCPSPRYYPYRAVVRGVAKWLKRHKREIIKEATSV